MTVPSYGVAMEEALVVEWLLQPGAPVKVDQPLVEIETDKTTVDVLAPVAGVLGEHRYKEGDMAPVGAVLTDIVEAGSNG